MFAGVVSSVAVRGFPRATFWKRAVWDAAVRTWALLADKPFASILVAAAIGVVAFALAGFFWGREALKDRLRDAVTGAVAVLVVAVGLFVVFLIDAPYRFYERERKRADAAETSSQTADAARKAAEVRARQLEEPATRVLAPKPHAPSAPTMSEADRSLKAAIDKALHFPDATRVSSAQSGIEPFFSDQTPRVLFEVLMEYDGDTIARVPRNGKALQQFEQNYYSFRANLAAFESDALDRIGTMVTGRLRRAWQLYFRYAMFRFAGLSRANVEARGNFLNYGITWDDAERVYAELGKDSGFSVRFGAILTQYAGFVAFTDKLKSP